ncbi:hypothetical protein BpHYR1_041655 [Brachionus plicatilis]|uniref:Uncharacterized protein n=1 Tax=Brachionus plicatilis TaxID=10195 RepID=A0A3M7STU2_BRAPC|nr:hypothetical protein BpHYR1_041655 [Brachionus plicatilis]
MRTNGSKKLIDLPKLPHLPVLPILCTYSSISRLSLGLEPVTVNGSGRIAFLNEEKRVHIRFFFVLYKNHGSFISDLIQNFNALISFFKFGHFVHRLFNICIGSTNLTHCQKQVVIQKVLCQSLDFVGKSGRKHERASNISHRFFEAHVQHAVRFVKHKILYFFQAYFVAFYDMQKTARRGHQNIAAFFHIAHLIAKENTTV